MASAALKSIFSSEPWPPIVSATGRASVSTLVMLAERVHAARCQNWRDCVLARSWVSSMRSGSAIHGGLAAGSAETRYSAAMFSRRKASVAGQFALLPKPSAAR